MDKFLSDQSKFTCNSISKEPRRHLKPVRTGPGIMCGSCRVHENALIVVHIWDQLYVLHRPVHKSLQNF